MAVKKRSSAARARSRPDACVFCGERPTTVEDVLPKWIHRYLGRRPTVNVGGSSDTGPRSSFRTLSYTATARCVCQSCNSGWMSELERSASELLKRMFDEKIHLHLASGEGQQLVAQWAMKTALMLQFTQPQPSIPMAVYG